jgi:hypothetical protein
MAWLNMAVHGGDGRWRQYIAAFPARANNPVLRFLKSESERPRPFQVAAAVAWSLFMP